MEIGVHLLRCGRVQRLHLMDNRKYSDESIDDFVLRNRILAWSRISFILSSRSCAIGSPPTGSAGKMNSLVLCPHLGNIFERIRRELRMTLGKTNQLTNSPCMLAAPTTASLEPPETPTVVRTGDNMKDDIISVPDTES